MNELVTREDIKIENMIYEIRGKEVMLDSDLAKLYGVQTKRINEAVKNNMDKFPERFSWKLTDKESSLLLVENFDQKVESRGGRYKNPRVFTEQGVAMLATILKSKTAVKVSIAIMDAFVVMRKYINSNLLEQKYINDLVLEHESEIKYLKLSFDKLSSKVVNNHIFFEGQIYDAYSLMLDIFETSKESIIILDNYTDKKLLDILSKTNKDITIYSKNMDIELIKKYQIQYNNITIKYNDSFHDRFIIIDNKTLYHCGSSFKDLGKKCFAINKIEDSELLSSILKIL